MPAHPKRLRLRVACIALSVSLLSACATGTDPRDPFEPFNRGVYSFNEGLDRAILKPVSRAYRAVLPQFVRASVSNFFSNINDIVVAVNNLLQGKFTDAYSDLGRVAINSTVGVLGLFDVATEAGIEKHEEDFGQTLGRWGIASGPFIMLPFLGPSTGRDTVGRVGDYFTDVVTYVDPTSSRLQLWGTRVVNRRAELLDASTVLQTAALDPYEFVRDAYLQRRRTLIYDGAPPRDADFLDAPPLPSARATPALPPLADSSSGFAVAMVDITSLTSKAASADPRVEPGARMRGTSPAAAPRTVAKAANTRGAVATREAIDNAEWDRLAPGQLTFAGAPGPAEYRPNLSQLWDALRPSR